MQSEVLKMPFICCAAAIPELQQQRNTEPIRGEKENRTGVPDRRLHGVALLQQHLDERGADVVVRRRHEEVRSNREGLTLSPLINKLIQ